MWKRESGGMQGHMWSLFLPRIEALERGWACSRQVYIRHVENSLTPLVTWLEERAYQRMWWNYLPSGALRSLIYVCGELYVGVVIIIINLIGWGSWSLRKPAQLLAVGVVAIPAPPGQQSTYNLRDYFRIYGREVNQNSSVTSSHVHVMQTILKSNLELIWYYFLPPSPTSLFPKILLT